MLLRNKNWEGNTILLFVRIKIFPFLNLKNVRFVTKFIGNILTNKCTEFNEKINLMFLQYLMSVLSNLCTFMDAQIYINQNSYNWFLSYTWWNCDRTHHDEPLFVLWRCVLFNNYMRLFQGNTQRTQKVFNHLRIALENAKRKPVSRQSNKNPTLLLTVWI